jgi:hypothetical protein
MSNLPDLTSLHISEKNEGPWERWVEAITDGAGWSARPAFRTWPSVRAKQKHSFYDLINQSENDRFSARQYNSPYTDDDIDVILRTRSWSIEHVLPRWLVNGGAPGEAEEDWLGWDVADSRANSARSNLPLVLWPTPTMKVGRVRLDGDPQTHFNPLEVHKARLARKWLFLRATYSRIDRIDAASISQRRYADAIIANVRESKIGYAERRFQGLLEEHVSSSSSSWSSGATWSNPLYGPRADEFLIDANWKAFVFQAPR